MADHPPRKRSVWFRWIRRVLYGLAMFVAWKLAGRWYDMHKATKEYEKAAAELDRTDPGWRWEEIEAQREEIPPERNSAVVVQAVAKMLPRNWPSQPAAASAQPRPQAINVGRPGLPDTLTLLDRLREVEPNYLLTGDLMDDLRTELEAAAEPLA